MTIKGPDEVTEEDVEEALEQLMTSIEGDNLIAVAAVVLEKPPDVDEVRSAGDVSGYSIVTSDPGLDGFIGHGVNMILTDEVNNISQQLSGLVDPIPGGGSRHPAEKVLDDMLSQTENR